jgi:hypothetical protein
MGLLIFINRIQQAYIRNSKKPLKQSKIMKQSEFLSPTEKGRLIEMASINDKAADALLNEFDRLENRIRDLEIAVSIASIAADKGSKPSLPDYQKLMPLIVSNL